MEILFGKELNEMRAAALKELAGRIIPYWAALKDDEHGGFYGYVSYDLKTDRKAEKGCILLSRILWFFSEAAIILEKEGYEKVPELKALADHAFAYLKDNFFDRENGGVYWSVSYDGKPLDTGKHTYCQSFAIYGLSAYHGLTGNREALDMARGLFDLIEGKMRDKDGYLEAFDAGFTEASNEKLSENGVNAVRTMNTLLHVFEAYTKYYEVSQDERAKEKCREMIHIFLTHIWNLEKRRQEVFFDRDYASLIDLSSYGHDIESSWLFDEGTDMLNDEALKEEIAPALKVMAEEILEHAFDGHSLPAEAENGKVKETRIWWVQAETVNGFLNAALRYPEGSAMREKFVKAALSQWDYIMEFQTDKRPGGEWYQDLDKDGRPIQGRPVTEPWKCPYHNGRTCLEILKRTGVS